MTEDKKNTQASKSPQSEKTAPAEKSAKPKAAAPKPAEVKDGLAKAAPLKESAASKAESKPAPAEKASASKESAASKPAEAEPSAPPSKESAESKTAESKPAPAEKASSGNSVRLEGLFAFKMSMSSFYNDKGESIPVTALKYEPCRISQIKTKEKDSYEAAQVAFKAQKNKRCSKARISHLKPAGFKEGARFIKEIRQQIPEGIKVGQELSIESLKKGDLVKISSFSKGRGFAGVMKRWNFAGGKASHGSKTHRRTGSIGQHTEPARVFPGRKMPGQYGFKQVSRSKVLVVDVLPEEKMIFVKGPVPGARNTLVSIKKMPQLGG